jgi:hypothetical protein
MTERPPRSADDRPRTSARPAAEGKLQSSIRWKSTWKLP